MRDQVWAPPRLAEPVPKGGKEPLPLGEASGLSKIEAEDLLDLLEAAGYEIRELSFIDGEGFRIRSTLPPVQSDPPPAQS